MGKNKKSAGITQQRINPYQGSAIEQAKKIEKQAFVACVAAVAAVPTSLLGFGIIMGVVGLVLGLKAKRPDGSRPIGAIVAIVMGILSVILAIPGLIVIYGTYINPNSQFVQNLVNAIFGLENMIMFL
ncbi:MAG: hypothetical protein IJ040_08045 [Lachnospiraceae bacterium]|nr:hypothetical protein [Lachnospiraceae bacterium]